MSLELISKIHQLKTEKNAAIIAHYYQSPEIQDLADFVGDSLAMAKYGKDVDADCLVICGVKFMAETAKILSPEKTVLLPNPDAGCPMADMVDAKSLSMHKKRHPNHYIVSYVNTSVDVKALTDICVTSSNALHIIRQLDQKEILFLPDKNLGHYINTQLPNQQMHLWPGFCRTHDRLKPEDVKSMKVLYPGAEVLVHPECDPSVIDLADFVGSTAGIIHRASASSAQSFIICTEEGVLHRLKQNEPEKAFHLASSKLLCQNMKKTKLEDVYRSLLNNSHETIIDETTRLAAYDALDQMLALS
ncbi:MAG: quinolinate synthase [Firmicutes bacterium HGW-Firmicutes-3]|nr:MAG: quinolinate synthase [Firmicutes bacterium HGW-Firmicutes-3]